MDRDWKVPRPIILSPCRGGHLLYVCGSVHDFPQETLVYTPSRVLMHKRTSYPPFTRTPHSHVAVDHVVDRGCQPASSGLSVFSNEGPCAQLAVYMLQQWNWSTEGRS